MIVVDQLLLQLFLRFLVEVSFELNFVAFVGGHKFAEIVIMIYFFTHLNWFFCRLGKI